MVARISAVYRIFQIMRPRWVSRNPIITMPIYDCADCLLWPSANPFAISVSYTFIPLFSCRFLYILFVEWHFEVWRVLITDFQEMEIIEEQNVVDEQMFNNYIVTICVLLSCGGRVRAKQSHMSS